MRTWNSIVPQPLSLELTEPEGSSMTQFYLELQGPFVLEAELFAARHPQLLGKTPVGKPSGSTSLTAIRLEQEESMGAEAYYIELQPDCVRISASDRAGAFYATMTLSQWLWQHSQLPLGRVRDQPRFVWRGFMLDVARHFFPASYLKELMEQLAAYKINRFHLHLADDQGWRLPIAGYPKLSELGSRRYGAFDHFYDEQPERISKSGSCDSGYYSVEEIAELNRLAARLHMLIVPEIDLPGHATAALACYPELQCDPASELRILPLWGISRNVLCLARPQSWDFVHAVLDEVARLFPGPYIHLGGDEVPRHNWQNCPDCRELMRTEGLEACDDLQNLFTRRSRDYLCARGKQPLYWDEVEESGLSEGGICCFWRSWNGADWDIRAARKGVPVISCPVDGCYLDYKHSSSSHEGGNLGVNTVYESYHFATLAERCPELAAQNLGVQANLWTERLCYPSHVEYMTYPRLLAISEQAWNKGGWPLFQQKWPQQQKVLQSLGVRNYYRGYWK